MWWNLSDLFFFRQCRHLLQQLQKMLKKWLQPRICPQSFSFLSKHWVTDMYYELNLSLNCAYSLFELVCINDFVMHREAESQLSSDTDLEDPDGKNARTGKGMVCFLVFLVFNTFEVRVRQASHLTEWVVASGFQWTWIPKLRDSKLLLFDQKLSFHHCLHKMSVVGFSSTVFLCF